MIKVILTSIIFMSLFSASLGAMNLADELKSYKQTSDRQLALLRKAAEKVKLLQAQVLTYKTKENGTTSPEYGQLINFLKSGTQLGDLANTLVDTLVKLGYTQAQA